MQKDQVYKCNPFLINFYAPEAECIKESGTDFLGFRQSQLIFFNVLHFIPITCNRNVTGCSPQK
jgi:hypothetical protein